MTANVECYSPECGLKQTKIVSHASPPSTQRYYETENQWALKNQAYTHSMLDITYFSPQFVCKAALVEEEMSENFTATRLLLWNLCTASRHNTFVNLLHLFPVVCQEMFTMEHRYVNKLRWDGLCPTCLQQHAGHKIGTSHQPNAGKICICFTHRPKNNGW